MSAPKKRKIKTMAQKNSVGAETLATFAGSSLSTSFQAVNSGFANPCFLLRFINETNLDVTISYDGSTANDVIKAGTTAEIYTQQNALPASNIALFRKGTTVYVKSTGAGTGSLYLAGYYQQD